MSTMEDLREATSTVEAAVTRVDDMEPGTMKLARVGEHRVVVIRTASGFHALDNACPHQGYGLATGSLDGELVTCQWHNWKYRVTDGRCVIGEEDVACHPVRIEGDDVVVSVTEPTAEEQLAKLWPSLRHGVDRFYRGQIARDTARLLKVGATAEELIADALRRGLPRAEWGMGHEMAVSADLLELSDAFEGIEKTLPVVHALTGVSETTRDRHPHDDPKPVDAPPDRSIFLQAIEDEDWATSVAALRALLANDPAAIVEARSWMIDAVSRHHYNYGHGAIYTQKAFQLIDRIPELADLLLPELALTLVYGTREDTLPYMRKANRAIDGLDLPSLAAAPNYRDAGWTGTDELVEVLLNADEPPIAELGEAVLSGAGIEGLLDVVSLTGSARMLRYDLSIEHDSTEEFGWLDMTHVLTYANAARWAWAAHPGPEATRLAFLTAFLAFDAGRGERRNQITPAPTPAPEPGDLVAAVQNRQPDAAVAHALAGTPTETADTLERLSLEDTTGAFIVMAHAVKMAVASRAEAEATGSLLPLAATARFLAAPRTERFVTRSVREAVEFVKTGQPPKR